MVGPKAVKREDLFLIKEIWGLWRSRMRAQSYLFEESESFFGNSQSRLYFVQFLKGLVKRKISTCKNFTYLFRNVS